jgi:Ca-activated chloride channel homolog
MSSGHRMTNRDGARWIVAALIFALAAMPVLASPRAQVKQGNHAAKTGNASEAMTHYIRALQQHGDSSVVFYNVGNVLYDQKQYEDAAKSYLGSLDPQDSKRDLSETFYNMGNAFFEAQKYDTAISAYIESLKRNPGDAESKYNLELARRMLKQQQQQQQQQQQDQQNQKDQQQQQQQQDQQQDQNKQDQKQEQQPQPDDQQQQQQQQQAQLDKQMSKEDAERLLNALLQDEQNALRDAKKVKVAVRPKREKDW